MNYSFPGGSREVLGRLTRNSRGVNEKFQLFVFSVEAFGIIRIIRYVFYVFRKGISRVGCFAIRAPASIYIYIYYVLYDFYMNFICIKKPYF